MLWVSILLLLAPIALANGAMGLGMEMWDLRYWAAYCLSMVAVEAWWMQRKLELSWSRSIFTSLVANAVTGSLCGIGCFAPVLHQPFVGTGSDPSPFWNSVVILLMFAIPSALAESVVWKVSLRDAPGNKIVLQSLFVHLWTIPIGLVILLLPARPYLGLEATAEYRRFREIQTIARGIEEYLQANERLPSADSPAQLLAELRLFTERKFPVPTEIAFQPVAFGRFGDLTNGVKMEFNPELRGMTLKALSTRSDGKRIWFGKIPSTYPQGGPIIFIEPAADDQVKVVAQQSNRPEKRE